MLGDHFLYSHHLNVCIGDDVKRNFIFVTVSELLSAVKSFKMTLPVFSSFLELIPAAVRA